MKIDRIGLTHLRIPLVSPFETSFGRITTRDCILVELHSGGIHGVGECVADRDPGYGYETSGTAWHILEEFIVPSIIGNSFNSAQTLLRGLSHIRGHSMAKAGVEMAFLDLQGKASGKSLKTMIGGKRTTVDVGVSVGLQADPGALVKTIERYLDDGYKRVKIKIKPGRDVGDTKTVREAFPDLRLQVDANSAYTLESAWRLQPLDHLNLLLIEQPLAEDDLWDHHLLQRSFKTPLCLDESITSPRHARQAIEMEACKIINIKTGRVGGLMNGIAIHDLAMDAGFPVWCGGMLETGIGRAANLALASLPNFALPGDISATDRYYEEDITQERFALNPDSTIDVPDSIGLGITLDRESIRKFSLRTQSYS